MVGIDNPYRPPYSPFVYFQPYHPYQAQYSPFAYFEPLEMHYSGSPYAAISPGSHTSHEYGVQSNYLRMQPLLSPSGEPYYMSADTRAGPLANHPNHDRLERRGRFYSQSQRMLEKGRRSSHRTSNDGSSGGSPVPANTPLPIGLAPLHLLLNQEKSPGEQNPNSGSL